MMKWIKDYFQKQKRSRIISDGIFFVLLLVLLLVPGARKNLSAFLIRYTMTQPGAALDTDQIQLQLKDYQWYYRTSNGQTKSFTDHKGQVVLLNFWATWCPPCIAEMPSMQRLYETYGDQISFVLISNEKPEVVQKFMQQKGYTLPSFQYGTEVPEVFASQSIPTTFLISKDGKVVLSKTGAGRWDGEDIKALIDKLL